ncbi:DUF805 domain-containing protein [Rufibacter roseus]|uniref:DUF805 domain-containing protein n=1 Tax=Rufibacter roseus TaxID=1567108 RepID=A0ABW2DJT5_9BACT|nr:DUF805 domain-containing protein [Rufibacter roseus]
MFKNPFSFNGRIRRTEYGVSFIIYAVLYMLISWVGSTEGLELIFIASFPLVWFFWAQGAKRCHDRGNSGWYQLIPFYFFWLLFADGEFGPNEYGDNPKGLGNEEEELLFGL